MNNSVYILKDRAILYVNGKDAKDFLQNLISNDINKVTNNSSCFASLLSPQGKYLYEFIVVKYKKGYLIECEKKSQEFGAITMLISNNEKSPIINSANYFFNMFAGVEKSVAATKSFVQTLLILKKLVFICQGKQKINDNIKLLSDTLLKDANNQWSTDLVDNSINSGFILGRGVGFALSNEMSLKFKELCQEMIEPFSSAEVMHGPKSLIQDTFKLFTLSMNDKSGLTVQNDSNEITKYTKLVYDISSTNKKSNNFYFLANQIIEFDSIVIMAKFYPWIVRYTQNKGLDPDKPRYLTKVTQTF